MTRRRLLSTAVAAALAAAAVVAGPAPAASAAPTGGGPVAVPSDGTTVATPFSTVTGRTYRVAVTGAYSYNGRQNLADCGWWNPETAGDAWFPGGYLQVNGATAPCASQPYTTTHTYTWSAPGTGAPFTFRISDVGGPYDNVGSLVAEVVEEEAPPSVHAECAVLTVYDPPTQTGFLQITLTVVAEGGSGPALASGSCDVKDPSGRIVATINAVSAGPRAYGADVVPIGPGSYTTCRWGYAYWPVNGETRTDYGCP